jgi:hypothetical protein
MPPWISANCREDPHAGPCLGCDCTCHHVPLPDNFRELAGLPPKPEPEEDQ